MKLQELIDEKNSAWLMAAKLVIGLLLAKSVMLEWVMTLEHTVKAQVLGSLQVCIVRLTRRSLRLNELIRQ